MVLEQLAPSQFEIELIYTDKLICIAMKQEAVRCKVQLQTKNVFPLTCSANYYKYCFGVSK